MKQLLSVMLAGALGTGARYGANLLAVRWPAPGWPWSTFAVNILGSFCIGLVTSLRLGQRIVPDEVATVLTVGFLGGFTTFSSLSNEGVVMLQNRAYGLALLYLGGSLVTGLVAAWLGTRLGRMVAA